MRTITHTGVVMQLFQWHVSLMFSEFEPHRVYILTWSVLLSQTIILWLDFMSRGSDFRPDYAKVGQVRGLVSSGIICFASSRTVSHLNALSDPMDIGLDNSRVHPLVQ